MEDSKKRIPLWDHLKFFMILLVVIGHFALMFYNISYTCRSVYMFIYSFHMPVLFFVSGIHYSDKNMKQRIAFYLCSGVALKLGLAMCNYLLGNTVSFSLLSEGEIPWFMFVLAHYYILMVVFRGVRTGFVFLMSIILACFIGYDRSVGDYLVISRTIVFYPYFLMGILCKKVPFEKVKENRILFSFVLVPVSAAIIIVWGCACFFHPNIVTTFLHLFKGNYGFSENIFAYGPIARLGCYGVATLIGLAIIMLCPQKPTSHLSKMGTRTIHVYYWHMIVYFVLAKVISFEQLFSYGLIGKLTYFVIGILVCVVISSSRIFEWPLAYVKKAIYYGMPINLTHNSEA